MKKLNSKYVESIIKKSSRGQNRRGSRGKTLEHGPNWEKAGDKEYKKKGWKAGMEAGAKSPVEKNGDLEQEIPWKQITS